MLNIGKIWALVNELESHQFWYWYRLVDKITLRQFSGNWGDDLLYRIRTVFLHFQSVCLTNQYVFVYLVTKTQCNARWLNMWYLIEIVLSYDKRYKYYFIFHFYLPKLLAWTFLIKICCCLLSSMSLYKHFSFLLKLGKEHS